MILLGFMLLLLFLLYFSLLFCRQPTTSSVHTNAIHFLQNLPVKKANRENITTVTYNIGYASGDKNNKGNVLSKQDIVNNLNKIVSVLQDINPDIVFLQEVDFDATRSHHINQWQWIASKLNLPYVATAITWNHHYVPWPFWPPSLQFGKIISGQVVLSRFPLEEQKIHYFQKPKENPFWYNWFYLNRVLQEISININNKKYLIYNLHLEAFQKRTREKQIHFLTKEISQNKKTTLFVAGDFNETISELIDFQKNTELETSEKQNAFTFPSWKAKEKIDYLFFNKALFLQTANVSPGSGSDHLPVWARYVDNF